MSSDNEISKDQFWKSIIIYTKKSHLVNRRLSGSVDILLSKIKTLNDIATIINTCKDIETENISIVKICEEFNCIQVSWQDIEECLIDTHDDDNVLFLCIQKLLSKSPNNKNIYRLSIIDRANTKISFTILSSCSNYICPKFNYSIILDNERNIHKLSDIDDANKTDSSYIWLENVLLSRLYKWSVMDDNNKNKVISESLKLVNKNDYHVKYNELKLKYGTKMVEIWPESTDPKKFVYEDVAIATYLILLWENERKILGIENKQTFVDLGCGNGLLVYILCSEGHHGKGIDVRKRNIWDLYPDFVQLQIATITPSDENLFKGYDWLIGNHSDELSPWVPVFSMTSSFNCKYFLLPCCAFEFDGSKYQRKNSSLSQYNEYLQYVEKISIDCGFKTLIDRLKIPSTKRICLIGSERTYSAESHHDCVGKIRNFVADKCSKNLKCNEGDEKQWMDNIKTRNNVEEIRNCTSIDKTVVSDIVTIVFRHLLKINNYIDAWNAGGTLPISDIAALVPGGHLKILKSEFGGLQTLLRNHHSIFAVIKGSVNLRYPITKTELAMKISKSKNNKKKIKISPSPRRCYFFDNHPDKCPLSSEDCSYTHS